MTNWQIGAGVLTVVCAFVAFGRAELRLRGDFTLNHRHEVITALAFSVVSGVVLFFAAHILGRIFG